MEISAALSARFRTNNFSLPENKNPLKPEEKSLQGPRSGKASDLEKLREQALLREFEEHRESRQKRLEVFRLKAVRAGFKKAWQERNYATIITGTRKIPENVLQEDPKLLMWYDQALTRMGGEL